MVTNRTNPAPGTPPHFAATEKTTTVIMNTLMSDVARQYEMVNSFMRLFGEPEIGEPSTGSAREKMDYLISTYTSRLLAKKPQLSGLPEELWPDALLIALRQSYHETFPDLRTPPESPHP